MYIQTHKKPHTKLGIHKGWCANLPDTIQLYLYLGSYGSDAELFVHTVKKKNMFEDIVDTDMDKKSEECRVKTEVIEMTDFKIPSKPRKENEPNQDFSFYLTIAN